MNNHQLSAKARAEQELQADPLKYKKLGRLGGLAQVPKGLSKQTPQNRQRIALLSVVARAEKGQISEEAGRRAAEKLARIDMDKSVADFLK